MMKKLSALAVMAVWGCGGDSSSESSTDPMFVVDRYDSAKAYAGRTFFTDSHDPADLRFVEVDMDGDVMWEVRLSDLGLSGAQLDGEYFADTDTVLLAVLQSGLYEIDYDTKTILWSYETSKVSHDADRVYRDVDGDSVAEECLLYVWGMGDQLDDAQVKLIRKGSKAEVWSWKAKDHFGEPYLSMGDGGDGSWTHANAVSLLPDGQRVLISLRDFQMTVLVDYATGAIVNQYDWAAVYAPGGDVDPHEPEWIPGMPNRVLVCLQNDSPYQAVEIEWPSGTPVWTYAYPDGGLRTARDADRLPNGNTLLQGVLNEGSESVLLEVTSSGEIVWRLRLVNAPATSSPGHFYKAQRV